MFDVPWYYLLGGVLGAAYVTIALIADSTIGAGGVAAATITGQLAAAVVIDRIGRPRARGNAHHLGHGWWESACCWQEPS